MCGSRKSPYPHHRGDWKFRGGRGGEGGIQRPRKFQSGAGLDNKKSLSKGLNSNSVRKLLLTDLVDHFGRHINLKFNYIIYDCFFI